MLRRYSASSSYLTSRTARFSPVSFTGTVLRAATYLVRICMCVCTGFVGTALRAATNQPEERNANMLLLRRYRASSSYLPAVAKRELVLRLRRYCASNSHLPMNYDKQTTGLLRMYRASSSYLPRL